MPPRTSAEGQRLNLHAVSGNPPPVPCNPIGSSHLTTEPPRMTITVSEVNKLKHAPAHPRILPVILQRWSPRSFAGRDVSSEDLRTIFEAVRWAASSYNEQPWRFLVGRRGSETYQKILESLIELNQVWAKTAPVLILDAAKTTFSHNNSSNPVAIYDLGAA